MLRVPESHACLRVLGIDPGGSSLGLSMLVWDFAREILTVEHAFTVTATHLHYPIAETNHHKRLARLMHLSDQFTNHLREFAPHVVVSESPFMGSFAAAFKSLSEVMIRLQQDVYIYNPHVPFLTYAPLQVKQGIGVNLKRRKGLEKEDNRQALQNLTQLQWKTPFEVLDEHAVDATAVGVTYIGEHYRCLPH